METLIDIIESLGIQLEITDALPKSINGFYYQDDVHDIIVINDQIKTEAEFKSVLSHELGHYFTTGFNFKAHAFIDLIHTERDEVRATRWACEYLIPSDDLMERLCCLSDPSLQTLADHYNISTELMRMKFYFMSLISVRWPLSETKVLLLSGLPSIFVVECECSEDFESAELDEAFWCSERLEKYLCDASFDGFRIMCEIG